MIRESVNKTFEHQKNNALSQNEIHGMSNRRKKSINCGQWERYKKNM